MSEEPTPQGPGGLLELPLELLDEVIRAIPKVVARSRSQVDLARSLAAHLPCVGGLLARPQPVPVPAHEEPEPVDVLTVVARNAEEPVATGSPSTNGAGAVDVPAESDLAVPDYDSLAASQVVPRLSTLSPEELEDVRRYESAHRNRQTILNRVGQLLAD